MHSKVVSTMSPNQIGLEEVDIEPSCNEVLVKVHLSSICGTDKNYSQGKMPTGVRVRDLESIDSEAHNHYPLKMGHEGSGTIVAVGEGVSEFQPGDQVMSFGWYNTMANYFVAPVRHNGYGVIKVPKGMSMDSAALGEPTACAIYAGMQSGVELGDTVAVIGAGFAGQVIAQVVKKMGAAKVIVVDFIDNKLELAKKMGADIIINASGYDIVDIILKETDYLGVDVAIEVAGNDAALQTCTDILKHGGILGIYSWILDSVSLRINRWHNDGFDIRTLALMHRIKHDRLWWIEKTLSNVANGIIKIEPLISHVFPLEEAAEAFNVACNDASACKVMLNPNL